MERVSGPVAGPQGQTSISEDEKDVGTNEKMDATSIIEREFLGRAQNNSCRHQQRRRAPANA